MKEIPAVTVRSYWRRHMMSTRRSFFTTGVLLSALVLFGSTAVQAQPAAPTSVSAVAVGYDSVTVSWAAVTFEGLTGYEIGIVKTPAIGTLDASNYEMSGATKKKVGATVLSTQFTGLVAGTGYTVAVRALAANDATVANRMGPWALAAEATTTALPGVGKVMDLRLTGGDGMIMAEWDAVSDPIGIHHYKVTTTAAGGFSITQGTGSNDTMFSIMNLTNGTEYTVKVAAVAENQDGSIDANADGTPDRLGPDSDPKKATPMAGDGDMTETPALPLVGILLLGAGLVAAGRRRLQQ